MPLPETIPVKYSEEEAEYVSLRPLVRQTFRLRELVDMILAVTGKEGERVQQVLRSGTTVYHGYRYWWQGFEASGVELQALLAEFPDAQPQRPFRIAECTAVRVEAAAGRTALRLEKEHAARRGFLRRRSLWDCLGALAQQSPPAYSHYSYEQRADCYVAAPAPADWPRTQSEWLQKAPRELRAAVASLPAVPRVLYFCPRRATARA